MGTAFPLIGSVVLITVGLVAGLRESRRDRMIAVIAIMLAALLVRAAPIESGLPYLRYIDEGHVLHRAAVIASTPTWDAGWYLYPPLLAEATGTITWAYDLVAPGDVFPAGFEADPEYYDDGMPAELVMAGRLVVLAASLVTVLLAIGLGWILVGWRAGLLAGVTAAVLPAFVARAAIVTPHTLAGTFVLGSVVAAAWMRNAKRPAVAAALSGIAAGLAFSTTYFTALVGLVVAAVALTWVEQPVRKRIRLAAVAALGCVAAIAVSMPAIWLQPDTVADDISAQTDIYSSRVRERGYLEALFEWSELGPLLAVLAVAGAVALLVQPRSRPVAIGALAFIGFAACFLTRFDFRPVQPVTPLLGLLAVAAGVGINGLAELLRAPLHRATGFVALGLAVAVITVLAGIRDDLVDQVNVEDTRALAVDRLARETGETDRVLVVEELAVAESDLERLPGSAEVAWMSLPEKLCEFDFVLSGQVSVQPEGSAATALARMEQLASLGSRPTPQAPSDWRTNDQLVTAWRVVPEACAGNAGALP